MTFITCSRKKSMPKVSISICEKCTKMKKCPDYALFRQPVLFSDLMKSKSPVKRRAVKIYKDKEDTKIKKEEQLKLGFIV
jgi:hypothetical protein